MLTLTDLFCGAGGSSSGAERIAGVKVVMAANHWKLAVDTHALNIIGADHDCADISQVDPRRYPLTDILWASPECTNHSQARGRRKADRQPDLFEEVLPDAAADRSRATMFDVLRFAEAAILRGRPYKAIIVENVVEVRDWMFYPTWHAGFGHIGYCVHIVYMNSMFAQGGGHGAAQSRDRWYAVAHLSTIRCPDLRKWTRPLAVCDSCGDRVRAVQAWKNVKRQFGKYGSQYVWRCPAARCRGREVFPQVMPASSVIDWAMPGRRIGDRKRPVRAKTMNRIEVGLQRYASAQLVPAGGGWNTTTTPVTEPMRARTTRETEGLLTGPAAEPFVVALEGRADASRTRPVSQPLRTQTGRHMDALVVPLRQNSVAKAVEMPLDTVAAGGNHHGLLTGPGIPTPDHPTDDGPAGTDLVGPHAAYAYGSLLGADGRPLDVVDCLFRMLEPSEIMLGMAFTRSYTLLGNRRARVRQAGNAVTPPAARDLIASVVEAITGEEPQILATDREMFQQWWADELALAA